MKPHLFTAAMVLGLAPLGVAAAQAPPAPAAGQTSQAPTPPAGEQQKAEAALRKTITAFAASKPNLDDMDAPLANLVKPQSAAVSALLASWGALTGIEYKGWNPRSGVWAFQAAFEKGQAQWLIGLDKDGRIQTLWFKPVTA